MKRSGLGRGLDALLSNTQAPDAAQAQPREGAASAEPVGVRDVPIESIDPNPYQPRQVMDPAALEELVASVRVHGLIQPLVVARDGDRYTLIAGERRWRASQQAGLERVPVVVREATEREMLALAIIENVQRANLDAIESARAYRRLMDEFKLTQLEVAELVGKSRVTIANTVRLLNLHPDVQRLTTEGHLSEGHARALLGLDDTGEQVPMARRAVSGAWTVRQTEDEVRAVNQRAKGEQAAAAERSAKSPAGTARAGVDPDTAAATRELEAALGTRVEIRRQGAAGQVVIHFYSEEELNGIYDHLTRGA